MKYIPHHFTTEKIMRTVILSGIKMELGEQDTSLVAKAAAALSFEPTDIQNVEIIRKSVDARRNRPPHFVYVVKIIFSGTMAVPGVTPQGIHVSEPGADEQMIPKLSHVPKPKFPVVVIGTGPAGLFAAYVLALRGIHPILLERGEPVEERIKDVEDFWREGILKSQSNVFFGEGGAGTFSDGKLTSRSKNPYTYWVKKILIEAGAPPDILVDAKPHVGTDRLRKVIVNLRKRLMEMGCQIAFNHQVSDFLINDGELSAIVLQGGEAIKTHHVILAIGQNADDTYRKLYECGVKMEAKPFAMGLRVEHSQEFINALQYGPWSRHPQLPPAEYFVKATLPDVNRSVYTFCMCPGGNVIACSASEGLLVTNGMSPYDRSGEFANSAIVVNVRVNDFSSGRSPLDGLAFRQIWERKAFVAGGEHYRVPAQRMTDFLSGRKSSVLGNTSVLPGTTAADLQKVLPEFVIHALQYGMKAFNKKMFGFITENAYLSGVETRTSSPVRICRDSDGQSANIRGIYPCGEGAGYAGGIISSALDGMKAAQTLSNHLI